MRASRLLHMLLLLQNRGRMTSQRLAEELEVSQRTILRDVDAMTEAGLPVIVFQGNQGGIELGFNYRTRLTGLDADEAEALGIIFTFAKSVAAELGVASVSDRAIKKVTESFPDKVRASIAASQRRFQLTAREGRDVDPRLQAMVMAVRERRIVRLHAKSAAPKKIHPSDLKLSEDGWLVTDSLTNDTTIAMHEWGDINISTRTF